MKRTIVFLLAASAVTLTVAQQGIPKSLLSNFKSLQKKQLTYKKGVLRLVSPKPMAHYDAYSTAAKGLCNHYWSKPKDMTNFKLKRFEYVNNIGKQGFALNNPTKTCATMLKAKGMDAMNKKFTDNTWVCIVGRCRALEGNKKLSDYK